MYRQTAVSVSRHRPSHSRATCSLWKTLLCLSSLLVLSLTPAYAQVNKLFSFSDTYASGYNPFGKIIQVPLPDGGFYGTTNASANSGQGSIYRVTSTGAFATVGIFTTGTTGSGYSCPGGLTLGTDGNLYGVCQYGGQFSRGTIFQFVPNADPSQPGTINRLFSFSNAAGSPGNPQATPLFVSGVLYGTCPFTGTANDGVIWRYDITSGSLTTLTNFNSTGSGAYYPYAGLTLSGSGVLYGVTYGGGANGNGVLYSLNPDGSNFQIVANMTSQSPNPSLELVSSGGNLYGVTYSGGQFNRGSVYRLDSTGTLSIVTSFDGNIGAFPVSAPIIGLDGRITVVTSQGGSGGFGTLTSIDSGTGVATVLNSFTGTTALPYRNNSYDGVTGLVQGSDKKYYIATYYGGSTNNQPGANANDGRGCFCTVSASGVLKALYSFGTQTGYRPQSHLIQANDGNFYGTTSSGGNFGYGCIYRRDSNGNTTTFFSFNNAGQPSNGYQGSSPVGGLILGKDGLLYGTTSGGGYYSQGVLFSISTARVYRVIRHLRGNDGSNIQARLFQGRDGAFYGVCASGGAAGGGTIFRCTAAGTYTVLHHLNNLNNNPFGTGSFPTGQLAQDSAGNLYGTCQNGGGSFYGTVFRLRPSLPAQLTVLKSFTTADNIGTSPSGGLLFASNGSLYGICQGGGTGSSFGTIYRIDPTTGNVSLAYAFPNTSTGYQPTGELVQGPIPTGGPEGLLYGCTQFGGTSGSGTIFSFNTTSGALTRIASLSNGSTDVKNPSDGVIVGSDRLLYGVTQNYGDFGGGTVFNLDAGIHSVRDVSANVTLSIITRGSQRFLRVTNRSASTFIGPLYVVPTSITGGTITNPDGIVPAGYAGYTGLEYQAARDGAIVTLPGRQFLEIPITFTGTPTDLTAGVFLGRF